jgi:hypothetical protein
MKAGKREDRLFFIIQAVSFCLASTIRSLDTQISPATFVKSSRGQQQNATI